MTYTVEHVYIFSRNLLASQACIIANAKFMYTCRQCTTISNNNKLATRQWIDNVKVR